MPFSIFWTDTRSNPIWDSAIDFRSERKLLLGKRRPCGSEVRRLESFLLSGKSVKTPSLWSPRRQKRSVGWYLGTEGDWRLSESVRARGELTAYEKRGVFISPGLDWETAADDGFQEVPSKTVDTGSGRHARGGSSWGFDWREKKLLPPTPSTGSARGGVWRSIEWDEDSEVFRDFRETVPGQTMERTFRRACL